MRTDFALAPWELNLIRRIRQLERCGVAAITVDLVAHAITAKIDAKVEHLDHVPPTPALPGLAADTSRVEYQRDTPLPRAGPA